MALPNLDSRSRATQLPGSEAVAGTFSPLDDLPALITQTNILFQSLVERILHKLKLDDLLKPGMAPVLFALYEQDDCIIKDLSLRTRRSASALNSLLGRLQKSGVVELQPCERDGRAVRVKLTAKGRAMEPRVRELHDRVAAAVWQGLAPAEVTQAQSLLRRIVVGLAATEDAASEPGR
ncbi:MAG: MarR family winged helix-turn-helix transcriptional regulator [Verrucomicrobium sp.]